MRAYFVASEPTGDPVIERVSVFVQDAVPNQHAIGVGIQWSRTKTTDWSEPTFQVTAKLEEIQKAWMLLHRLKAFISKSKVDVSDPDAFLFRLESAGAQQAVYDPRAKKMIAVRDLAASGSRWKALDVDLEVAAETEEQAKRMITKQVQELMIDEPDRAVLLVMWFSQGMRLKELKTAGTAPKHVDLRVYLKRNSKGARALAAEEKTEAAEA